MKALLLAIKKIIAVITALFVPASTAAPIASNHNIQNDGSTVRIVEQAEEEDGDIEIVPDEDSDFAPAGEVRNEEAQEPAENEFESETENADTTYEAVKVWDVSATEDDHVVMAFYDTEDTEGLLEQLAGRITSLFTPMVAYAAEDENEPKVAGYEIFHEDGFLNEGKDYGEGAEAPEQRFFNKGTVVIYGEGEMQNDIYSNFMDKDLYVDTTIALFKSVEGLDVEAVIPDGVEDVVEIDAVVQWRVIGTDEYVEITDAMRDVLNPTDMLAFRPTALVIDEGVTNIANYAFTFCANLVRVEIPASVTEIGENAFAYCKNLTTVVLHEGLEWIDCGAFMYCTKLAEITVPSSVYWVGSDAFKCIAENAVITCPNQKVKNLFDCWNTTIPLNNVVIAE